MNSHALSAGFPVRQYLKVIAWTIVWLVVIDACLQFAFAPPPGRPARSSLQRYFDYGRSIEGKLEVAIGLDPAKDEQIVTVGWNNAEALARVPTKGPEGNAPADLTIALYGQSFTQNALAEAARLDGRIALRAVGGPGAPPNHSYAAYEADAPNRSAAQAKVVVFGVLSSAVPMMGSTSGLFWMFESPAPFTFPRYRLRDGALVAEPPLIGNEAQFRRAVGTRSDEWERYKAQLRREDRGWDAFTFEQSIADRSTLVRLVRRGWVAHRQAYGEGVYVTGQGFVADSEEVLVLQAMLRDLARKTRDRGERLVVLLLNTRGQADHLRRALLATLDAEHIDYVSTDQLFSSSDPSNFVADGHYSEAANRKLARAVLDKLGRVPAGR